MSTAKQIIVLRAPQYDGDARLDPLINLAKLEYSQAVFGDNYQKALALKVLHQLTLDESSGVGGAVASVKEGDLAMGFKHGEINTDLDATAYGKELKALIAKLTITPNIM